MTSAFVFRKYIQSGCPPTGGEKRIKRPKHQGTIGGGSVMVGEFVGVCDGVRERVRVGVFVGDGVNVVVGVCDGV